jgi:hypothetical protein
VMEGLRCRARRGGSMARRRWLTQS